MRPPSLPPALPSPPPSPSPADASPLAWVAWEPPAWVARRGPSLCQESEHFCIRYGGSGPSSARAARAAISLLAWLERCWSQFCNPQSSDFVVEPYGTQYWSDDGLRRKLNVYIGDTGLDPCPQQGDAYALQGTWVERPVEAVRHTQSNPDAKLHHAYLALHPNAAESERTVCHELCHVLQMHTGGHLDTTCVGYQWEAHAEYCVHLCKPAEPGWCPHVRVFLRTAHLPVDCTNYDGAGEGSGRQYVVWPFYAFLDQRFGAGTAHGLWHADRLQRQASGVSKDMISNFISRRRPSSGGGSGEGGSGEGGGETLGTLFGAFAMASLTMDWGWRPEQSAALLASADPLDTLRFTPLRPQQRPQQKQSDDVDSDGEVASWWMPDGSRPLKRCGFCTHRLDTGATEKDGKIDVELRALAAVAAGQSSGHGVAPPSLLPCDLHLGVAGLDPSGARHHPIATAAIAVSGGEEECIARLSFTPRAGFVYMLSVCAAPQRDEDFEPLEWGVPPASLPTYRYALRLQGCTPHRLNDGGAGQAYEQLLTIPQDGVVRVPTGLTNLQPAPKLSGGGASLTSIDLRSGNPGEVNTVLLSCGRMAAQGRTLRRLNFAYRCVIGYSGGEGAAPGPYFELQLVDGAELLGGGEQASRPLGGYLGVCSCCRDRWQTMEASKEEALEVKPVMQCAECSSEEGAAAPLLEPVVHTLYRSPEMEPRPYSWDAATGGHPTNYCPPVEVDMECGASIGALRGETQSLRLVFYNGRRNMHIQGGEWQEGAPRAACAELGLRLALL